MYLHSTALNSLIVELQLPFRKHPAKTIMDAHTLLSAMTFTVDTPPLLVLEMRALAHRKLLPGGNTFKTGQLRKGLQRISRKLAVVENALGLKELISNMDSSYLELRNPNEDTVLTVILHAGTYAIVVGDRYRPWKTFYPTERELGQVLMRVCETTMQHNFDFTPHLSNLVHGQLVAKWGEV